MTTKNSVETRIYTPRDLSKDEQLQVFEPVHNLRNSKDIHELLHVYGQALKELNSETNQNVRMYLAQEKRNKQKEILSVITDELTGLFNKRHLKNQLPSEVERSARYAHDLSVVMLDIDHFKKCNDTHGHQVGDEVLNEYGVILPQAIRDRIDTAYRFGGEEFVLILPDTNKEGGIKLAERIRTNLESRLFCGDKQLKVTSSFGVADIKDADNAHKLIELADKALYYSKENGRNKVTAYDPHME